MPTRNINLTDRYDSFLAAQVESGRFKNVSEAVRAALHLLEQQGRREEMKLEVLRGAAQEGRDAYDRGAYLALSDDAALEQFFAEAAQRASKA